MRLAIIDSPANEHGGETKTFVMDKRVPYREQAFMFFYMLRCDVSQKTYTEFEQLFKKYQSFSDARERNDWFREELKKHNWDETQF